METEKLENQNHTEQSPATIAWGSFFEFIKTVGFILILAFFIRQFLVQPFVVDGKSMEPNFHNQEYILVDKLSYRLSGPARGDVVVFQPLQYRENFIKRIIGLPGEKITIKDNLVLINDVPIEESYLDRDFLKTLGISSSIERILGSNEYFVLGDNRGQSKDSRELGAIKRSQLIGRAWLVLFPVNQINLVKTPDYPELDTQAVVHDPSNQAA